MNKSFLLIGESRNRRRDSFMGHVFRDELRIQE